MGGFPSEAGPQSAALAGCKRTVHNYFTIFENRKTTKKLVDKIDTPFCQARICAACPVGTRPGEVTLDFARRPAVRAVALVSVKADPAKALAMVRKAADEGQAAAMTYLGRLYTDGKGAPQDDAEAHRWYLRAAERGDDLAMLILALQSREGRGVRKDEAEARRWLRKSATKGNAVAIQILQGLGEPLPKGTIVPPRN